MNGTGNGLGDPFVERISDIVDDMSDQSWQPPKQDVLDEDDLHTTANPQIASPFFDRLPLEIRQQIYEEVLLDLSPKLHLHSPKVAVGKTMLRVYNGIHAVPCLLGLDSRIFTPANTSECCTHWRCHELVEKKIATGELWIPGDPTAYGHKSGPHNLLQAMRTCKKAYFEAVSVLYGSPIYCFSHIAHFQVWRNMIPKAHADRIRSIELTQHISPILYTRDEIALVRIKSFIRVHVRQQRIKWQEGFRSLCDLTSLVSLKVALFPDPVIAQLQDEPELLAPLLPLADIKSLIVELPDLDSGIGVDSGERRLVSDVPGDAPYQVMRRLPIGEVEVTSWPEDDMGRVLIFSQGPLYTARELLIFAKYTEW